MCDKALRIEFLFSPGCCCAEPALGVLRRVLEEERCGAEVAVRAVREEEEAIRYRFHGSPTILIDGVDIEGPSLVHDGFSLQRCRIYYPHGECPGVPAESIVRSALYVHPAKRRPRIESS